jgi:sugar lactone lactonase YvrE
VLVYHPHTQQTHVVASGFYYSDGVALSEDGSYLLVVETDALRVMKVWLAGDKVRGQCSLLSVTQNCT